MVGPLVWLDVVEVLGFEVEVESVEVLIDELVVDVIDAMLVLVLVLVDELELLDVVELAADVFDVVVEDGVLEVEPPKPFLYILRRLAPPQNSFLFALQTMLHPVLDGSVPATGADPAWIVLPQ